MNIREEVTVEPRTQAINQVQRLAADIPPSNDENFEEKFLMYEEAFKAQLNLAFNQGRKYQLRRNSEKS